MRTTVTIDEDSFNLLKKYAKNRSLTLGKALSALIRKGFCQYRGMREENGIFVVDLPADSPKVTTEHILALEDEL